MQTTKDEFFAFDRTVSRLIEMQSVEYNLQAQIDGGVADETETMMKFVQGPIDDDAIEKLWMRYDMDGNGTLDEEEMSKLIGDLSMVRRKHRNVPDEEMRQGMEEMSGSKKSPSGEMTVEFAQFSEFVKNTSVKTILTRELSRM